MYARGMSIRDIENHLENLYGIDNSPELISRITDKIIPIITEWKNRPLSAIYAIAFMDAIYYKVRQGRKATTKAAYTAIGVDLGYKGCAWHMDRRKRISQVLAICYY